MPHPSQAQPSQALAPFWPQAQTLIRLGPGQWQAKRRPWLLVASPSVELSQVLPLATRRGLGPGQAILTTQEGALLAALARAWPMPLTRAQAIAAIGATPSEANSSRVSQLLASLARALPYPNILLASIGAEYTRGRGDVQSRMDESRLALAYPLILIERAKHWQSLGRAEGMARWQYRDKARLGYR